VLCTDGLWEPLTDGQIDGLAGGDAAPLEGARRLVARGPGGRRTDNVTPWWPASTSPEDLAATAPGGSVSFARFYRPFPGRGGPPDMARFYAQICTVVFLIVTIGGFFVGNAVTVAHGQAVGNVDGMRST